jgi:hypothetical protein
MPFAAVGFASVVSMIPGSNLIRMASGLVQLGNGPDLSTALLGATIFDGVTASTVILAMSASLIVPKLVVNRCRPLAWRKSACVSRLAVPLKGSNQGVERQAE